jgi:hypothetical protein
LLQVTILFCCSVAASATGKNTHDSIAMAVMKRFTRPPFYGALLRSFDFQQYFA